MVRIAGAFFCGLLVACTQTPAEPPPDIIASAAPTTAEPSMTPSPELTLKPTQMCDGLGRVTPRGEITFVRDGKLIGVAGDGSEERCLADLEGLDIGGQTRLAWNATGDRVLVGSRALSRDLSATRPLSPGGEPTWSRPTGKSVVWIADGRLMKRSSLGGKAIDISFLAHHDDVTYHPAGTHIATSGSADDGSYGLYLATNVGTEETLLARGEKARFITNLEFSQDGLWLYYSARHGPANWHLHRLSIGLGAGLATIAKQHADFEVAVSSFESDQHAYSVPAACAIGDEHSPFGLTGMKAEIPRDIRLSQIQPIGFLPGRRLVVKTTEPCGPEESGDIYVLSKRDPVLLAEDHRGAVAVRVPLPPPPPPPGEEQEVVA